jgi:hypothetical protein
MFFASAKAQDNLSNSLRDWDLLSENPDLKPMCAETLRRATALADLQQRNSTVVMMMRWGQQEAERVAPQLPSERLLPVGIQLSILKLIQNLEFGRPIYARIQGGFPQWAYRSCLKGKPID